MNITSLHQRLNRIEGQMLPAVEPPTPDPVLRLLEVLVACHLGSDGASPNESIASGMARGLGYERCSEFNHALAANNGTAKAEDLNQRWRDAMGRLFALEGTTPDCDGPAFARALEALHAQMPRRFREHPYLNEVGV